MTTHSLSSLPGGLVLAFGQQALQSAPNNSWRSQPSFPLITDTVQRGKEIAPTNKVRVLANARLTEAFQSLPGALEDDVYWIEPQAKGTCPALVWAAWSIERECPDGVMISLHSDHLIEPLDDFQRTIAAAVELARDREILVCVGVQPDRIETGYGHIQPGEAINLESELEAFTVSAFHEKPNAPNAERYLQEGYLWNTGMFVWKASTFLNEVRVNAPEVGDCLPLLEESPEAFFDAVPEGPVDTMVLERSAHVGVVQATFSWDDMGSWESLARNRVPDEDHNVVVGNSLVREGSNNIVFSEDGQVVLFGVDDLVVVQTDEATLVMPRDRASDLKTLLKKLEE
ncbi:MAG: mannose-1-phosphate guanylyltransferase [Gemmatimonadota bacterium]|nr:MAG: mannose-1-phosphate guanylyltransferase [Gemmatimonadota bacterium]